MNNYRRAYFSLVDNVCVETGNARYDLHNQWKERIFPFIQENPACFINEVVDKEFSTSSLSDYGWEVFYNEFKHYIVSVIG